VPPYAEIPVQVRVELGQDADEAPVAIGQAALAVGTSGIDEDVVESDAGGHFLVLCGSRTGDRSLADTDAARHPQSHHGYTTGEHFSRCRMMVYPR
jgi:hypothetical protein